jgi:hypothetical protein
VAPEAVIAAEDARFREHEGVDPAGLVRAVVSNVRTGAISQGGSTLTHQYVKNAFVGDERTLLRKVREAVIAIQLERDLSEDEILERYLDPCTSAKAVTASRPRPAPTSGSPPPSSTSARRRRSPSCSPPPAGAAAGRTGPGSAPGSHSSPPPPHLEEPTERAHDRDQQGPDHHGRHELPPPGDGGAGTDEDPEGHEERQGPQGPALLLEPPLRDRGPRGAQDDEQDADHDR